MCIGYLGFLLLIWLPGLHAQRTAHSCPAPELKGGYFVPEKKSYSHGTKLNYACNNGSKPAVEGWWATTTCKNGIWFREPQCIDRDACTSPDIPNAETTLPPDGQYDNGFKIRVTCHKGYKLKDWNATATCENGTWSSLPVCEKHPLACGVPSTIPHAVIINQEYQDVFAVDSELKYKCEDGFTPEGANTITCISGKWTQGPLCSKETSTDTRQSGSGEGGTGGGHTTAAGSGTQLSDGGSGTRSDTEHGSRTQPASGGSSTTSEKDRGPEVTIDNCRKHPNVPNGDVVQEELMFLKYQCNAYYTRVGPEKVMCYNDGTWSDLPVCKETFCVIDPAQFVGKHFELSRPEHMKEGQTKQVPCTWHHYSGFIKCTNGKISVTRCCRHYEQHLQACRDLHPLSG